MQLLMKKRFEKQELISYRYSRSGDMMGSSFSVEVKKQDETCAILRISESPSHMEKPKVTEKKVPLTMLSKIREVFLREGMYGWNGKKFTDMFIADGASHSYRFEFSEDAVRFSSQMYPGHYGGKLRKIDEVIESFSDEIKE